MFPHFAGLQVEQVVITDAVIHVRARRSGRRARCPSCRHWSRQIHSRYTRHVADAPVGGRAVQVQLQVRRFRCHWRRCPRRTFVEAVPTFAQRRRRRTVPLLDLLSDLGVSLGGRPGARFAGRHTRPVSRMTLIRLVRALPEPPPASPAILGVDDFALRRGHRYGTVLVDVAASTIIDLLPERTAATVATWLRAPERQPPTVICRDRGGEYALGARQGAPHAVQIADRFHLCVNSRQVLERVLQRHGAALRVCVPPPPEAPPAPTALAPPSSRAAALTAAKRAHRLAQYEQVVALRQEGLGITAIAAETGLCRPTVRTWLQAGSFPERPPRRTLLRAGTRFGEALRQLWEAGEQDAVVLWRALRADGYPGTLRSLQRAVEPWRQGPALRGRHTQRLQRPATSASWAHRPPSARLATWLLLKPLASLTPEERQMRERVLTAEPAVAEAFASVSAFRALVHDRDAAALVPWLVSAEASSVPEIRTFAVGIRKDQAAVQAALDYAWSSGRVEGQVTKIKQVKRAMYGRGNLDLLKRRVMHAA